MPLTGKSGDEIESLEAELLGGIPVDGTSIGNKTLREEVLGWETDLYLAVRGRLLENGDIIVGRGRGGSVRRIIVEPEVVGDDRAGEDDVRDDRYPDEESLYEPMLSVIRERWVRDQPFDQVLVERTDRGGRRPDGIWTRPDITLATMTSYTYVPGRHFDVVTFEIKHHDGLNVTAVYEALAHRRSATRAYLLVFVPDNLLENFESPTLSEISDEANRHGIGLIVAGEPTDFDTWDTREEASRVNPDPSRMNAFIRNQLSEGTKEQIVRWFR